MGRANLDYTNLAIIVFAVAISLHSFLAADFVKLTVAAMTLGIALRK